MYSKYALCFFSLFFVACAELPPAVGPAIKECAPAPSELVAQILPMLGADNFREQLTALAIQRGTAAVACAVSVAQRELSKPGASGVEAVALTHADEYLNGSK